MSDFEIVPPNFPPQADGYFKYLASIGLTEAQLQNCCVKKARVVGLYDRQHVNILLDGQQHDNVPVWIHTDIGARLALLKGEEYADPTDYFKDAALMFPFHGYDEQTYTYVYSVTSINDNGDVTAHSVIGIIQNFYRPTGCTLNSWTDLQYYITGPPTSQGVPWVTYRPHLKIRLNAAMYLGSTNRVYTTSVTLLFDALNGSVAEVLDTGGTTKIDAISIGTVNPVSTQVDSFLSKAVRLGSLDCFQQTITTTLMPACSGATLTNNLPRQPDGRYQIGYHSYTSACGEATSSLYEYNATYQPMLYSYTFSSGGYATEIVTSYYPVKPDAWNGGMGEAISQWNVSQEITYKDRDSDDTLWFKQEYSEYFYHRRHRYTGADEREDKQQLNVKVTSSRGDIGSFTEPLWTKTGAYKTPPDVNSSLPLSEYRTVVPRLLMVDFVRNNLYDVETVGAVVAYFSGAPNTREQAIGDTNYSYGLEMALLSEPCELHTSTVSTRRPWSLATSTLSEAFTSVIGPAFSTYNWVNFVPMYVNITEISLFLVPYDPRIDML